MSLPEEDLEVLGDLAGRKQTTVRSIIRHGIAMEKFIWDELRLGGEFQLRRKDGQVVQLVIPEPG